MRWPGARWLEGTLRSPLARRLATGAAWSVGGTVVSRALSLVSSVATARFLGKSSFGEFGVVVNTMGVFLAAASLGLGMTAMKYVAELRIKEPERAARIVTLTLWASAATGLLAAIALLILAPWMATRVLGAPGLASALRASAAGLLLSSIFGAQTGALAGFGAFRAIAVSNAVSAVFGLPCIVIGAAYFGVEGAVWGTTIGLVVGGGSAGYALRALTSSLSPSRSLVPTRAEWTLFWRFSMPAFLSSGMAPLTFWVTSAMLVNQPGGFGEMGIWNAANQWFTALLFLPTAISQVLMPALSERMGLGDKMRARRLLVGATVTNGILALLPALIGMASASVIMGLYGENFRPGWPTLVFSLAAAAVFAVQAPSAQLMEAAGHMWLRLAGNAGWALAMVGFTWLLLGMGAQGLALARAVAYVLSGIWVGWVASRIAHRRSSRSVGSPGAE